MNGDVDRGPESKHGTTLKVVLSLLIFGILIAILIPIFATDGFSASRVKCLSNLKQISLGTVMYAADSDDTLPPYFTFDAKGLNFVETLSPYVKEREIFLCPGDRRQPDQGLGMEASPYSLGYTHFLSLRGRIQDYFRGGRQLKLATIKDPEKIHYLRDVIVGFGPSNLRATESNTLAPGNTFKSPHGERFATGFLDGHAKVLVPGAGDDL